MPGRDFTITGKRSRHSINGQERSDELNDNFTTAKFWEYDSRIVRRWNVDPEEKKFPWQSPYASFDNNPIINTDPSGASTKSTIVNEKGKVVGGKIDGDKSVYMVKGLTEKTFNSNDLAQYKKEGTKIGETVSESSFQSPKTGKWLGQVNFDYSAQANLSQATKTLGTFMLTHSNYESFNEYKDHAGNFKGAYDLKTVGIPNGKNSSLEQRDAYAYEASFSSPGIIMTRRDQGNFFAGRAAKMLGLSESVTLSGFGAFEQNNNRMSGWWNKTKIGVMSAINILDQAIMGSAISGTPMQGMKVKPVFNDDKVSEDLQRAGYNQYQR